VHEALEDLESLEAPLARLVEPRVFGGLSVEEAAEVKRHAAVPAAWPHRPPEPRGGPASRRNSLQIASAESRFAAGALAVTVWSASDLLSSRTP
jgi:hypothetical protein